MNNTFDECALRTTLSLHTKVFWVNRDDKDRVQHRVQFGVVGANEPAEVRIASTMYRDPIIAARVNRGGLDLPDRLVDSLAIGVFRVVAGFIVDHDGVCGSWTAADATRWIQRHWHQDDAEKIVRELSRHATPGVEVRDAVVISDGDNV